MECITAYINVLNINHNHNQLGAIITRDHPIMAFLTNPKRRNHLRLLSPIRLDLHTKCKVTWGIIKIWRRRKRKLKGKGSNSLIYMIDCVW
ncbi:hypothetical protein Lalb_Chr03g0025121 [Lupinus albus]|uniref:Uncharacterized protein n=1 Tax=Lupinus albus TaxID=3870 RepID=A0A6A4QQZ9_LUPAL|nr:hypothetical protein Lalb_Chr03g0025121 [Lupinus albus]